MNQNRLQSIDLMRMVMMLFIIIHHLILNSANLRILESGSFDNKLTIFAFLNIFLVVAVNVFFLISGYFKIKFNFKKILKLIIANYFFFWIINIICLATKEITFDIDLIKGFIFPISQYWFILTYIILSFLAPFLNRMLDAFSINQKKNFVRTLFILFCLFCFFYKSTVIDINNGYSLFYAVFLYILGDFLSTYKKQPNNRLFFYFLFCIISGVIILFFISNQMYNLAWDMYSYNNPFVLLASVCLFTFFLNLRIKNNYKLINIGKYSGYIYIIHSTIVLSKIYNDFLIKISSNNAFIFLIQIVCFAFIILIVSFLMGFIFERIYYFIFNRISFLKQKK